MQIHDARAGYGWLSIGLHWAAAISVVMLWFIGNQMTAEDTPPAEATELLRVHTSIALTVYLLLFYRIFRRLYLGFPDRTYDQPLALFTIGRAVHFTLLLCVVAMLITGPLGVWSGGDSIAFFGLGEIPSPFAANEALHERIELTHRLFGRLLFVVFLVHVTGAMRQILFSKGETANRMLVATDADEH